MKLEKDASITFRINQELKTKLEEWCYQFDIPVAQYIREAIREKLEKEGK